MGYGDDVKPTLFHHIPKTAGTTLIMQAPHVWASHDPYESLQVRGGTMQQITILRDPVERVISWLNFISRPNDRLGARLRQRKASDFLAQLTPTVRIWIDERMVRQLGGDWMPTRPQAPMQEQFERARDRLRMMNWVGFSETYDENRPKLMELLGLPDPGPMRQNASRWSADIDPPAYDLIAEITEWDQRLYDDALASGSWPRVS